MQLADARVGPYLHALLCGLETLAPHGDYVPLVETTALLEALTPARSGGLLYPAELDLRSGLPALTWLERARAEHRAAQEDAQAERSDDEIERAYALDAALGARLDERRRLHRFLRGVCLLPASRLLAVQERAGAHPQLGVYYDHIDTDGCWERIRLSVAWQGALPEGTVSVQDRRVHVHDGLRHLLARHAPTPLVALHHQLGIALGGEVLRLARSRIGPFWFPGSPLPAEVPEALADGLTLHVASEVVGREVGRSRHLDPWRAPPEGELVPRGCQVYRERRFCASPTLLAPLEAWGRSRGVPVLSCPLNPRSARRTL